MPTVPLFPSGSGVSNAAHANADVSQCQPANADLSQILQYMKQQDQKRDTQHNQIVTSITGLTQETSRLKAAINTETSERKAETSQLREQIQKMEKRLDNFKPPGLETANDDISREKQVIVSGFQETDEQSIVQELQKTLTARQLFHRVSSVFTMWTLAKSLLWSSKQ